MSQQRQPGTLPVRRWLALALLAAFLIPFVVTAITAAVFVFEGNRDESTAAEQLSGGAASWTDPAWQAATTAELAGRDIDFVLFEDGREIYRSTLDPLNAAITDPSGDDREPWWNRRDGRLVERIVVSGAQPARTADIYSPLVARDASQVWRIPIAGFTTLLLTLTAIGWLIGRAVNRPLAATSQAARRVAGGDLDISLPSSRVREVADVNSAFESMSAALRSSLEEQAALEQERRVFIGAVAHDLRTPLFALRGYLEGLESGVAGTLEQRGRYIAVAREKADALERLISDLFDFTRLEVLEQTPNREPIDIDALLRKLVDEIQPLGTEHGVTVSVREVGDGCATSGDIHLLTRAIANLLDNALRFTPAGGSIVVACETTANGVAFTVADNGPGIDPADLPHLFAPLYRGESSRNRRTGGAGLGLTIARRILLAHGGDLTAANQPMGGAIFTGTLPVS